MIKIVFTALAGTLIAVASPALARVDAEPAASDTVPVPDKVAQAPKKTRYCVVDTITGSRVPVKSCRTRDDWLTQGFDPLKK